MTISENAINNSYQIIEEFKCKQKKWSFYRARKHKFVDKPKPPGKVKVYTEKEIYLYKVQRMLNNLTVCGQ